MALGSENMAYHHKPTQYQLQHTLPREVLRTRVVNHQRSIAPAPYTKPSGTHNNLLAGTTLDSNNPAVVRRNARERSRVKQVNNGFSTLRQHIPTAIIAEISNGRRGIGPGADKKLSKVDTLRMAAEYIRRLKKVIDEVDNSDTSSLSSYGTLSCNSSYASSISSTPPPSLDLYSNIKNNNNKSNNSTSMLNNNFNYQPLQASQTSAEYFLPLSYAGSFQQSHLISPANSCESHESYQFLQSPSHYQLTHQPLITPNTTPIKMEPSPFNFDDCHHNITSSPSAASTADDEELLDYISLWQEQ